MLFGGAKMELYRQKLLEMLNFLDMICIKNNLKYFAIGGTFLGAIRHNGFIPWDDDIDVCMPRKDYEKFENIVNSQKGKYIVETPHSKADDYCYSVSKLYDTTTTVIENIKYKTKRGVYIDVFPLDGIGNTWKEVRLNYLRIDFLNILFTSRTSIVRTERAYWKNFIIRIANLVPFWLLNEKRLLKKLDHLCASYDFEKYKYVGILLTQYRKKYIMEKSIFDEIERYKFENTTILGVKNYNKYLEALFGDWKKLPPKEKQVAGHDFSYIDLNHSYFNKNDL